jgi:membrane protease YdiL (CAAX protease family)
MEPNRAVAVLLAVLETAAALFGAILVTAVLTLPFTITRVAEFPLWPASAPEQPRVPAAELLRRVESSGLASQVELTERDGQQWLVLTGFSSFAPVTAQMAELLESAGYEEAEPAQKRTVDPVEIVREHARLALSIQALVFLALGLLMMRLRMRPVIRPGVRPLPALAFGVGGGFAAFAGSLVIGLLLRLIGFPVEEQAWVIEMLRDRANLYRLAPWIVLIVPLAEEVFFRGYVLRFVSQRVGVATGLAVSSALFAAVHFNLSGLAIYLTIGAILGLVCLRTRGLLAPIAAHMTHNALVLGVALVAPLPG